MSFDLIVFDWDGTLMDSTAHIAASIRQACAELGLAVPDDQAARQVIGLSLAEALSRVCPDLTPERYPDMVAAYRRHFFVGDETVQLFAGVAETIARLDRDGMLLAVATGKSQRGLARALEVTGLGRHFIATRTQDDCPSKPHPAMLQELMDATGCRPLRTLMVGDTTHDLLMAQAAGTRAAGIYQGAHAREDLEQCEALGLFPDFASFSRWLDQQIG